MRSRFFIPASLIIATLVLLISLGFWQLDRADEKRAIEDQIASANSGDVELVTSVEFLKDKEYYHVRLQGSYVGDKQFIYDNQIVDQISGYYVLTPFILTGTSKAVLINRGFIPWGGRRDKLANVDIGEKTTEVKVQISIPVKRMELKVSEITGDFPVLIQALDLDEMSTIASLDFASVVGLLNPESENGFVRKWEPYTGSIERHIGYAIQWFLMAFVLAFIGIRLAIKQRKK
jgi:surfeit locus 1 family protein